MVMTKRRMMMALKREELRKKLESYFDGAEYPVFTDGELSIGAEILKHGLMDIRIMPKNDDELGGNDGSQTN